MEWVSAPCEGSVGMYFYCFHGVLASSPYNWMSIQCKIIRVVEDLPPVLAFYDAAEAAHNERYRTAPRSRFRCMCMYVCMCVCIYTYYIHV